MKNITRFLLVVAILASAAAPGFGQDDTGAGAACGVMACGMFVYILILLAMIAVAVTIIVIIFRFIKGDAVARGMPNATSMPWLGLLGLMGLIIYLLMRPQGNVMPCQHCGKNRMQGLPTCPQCGNP